MGCTPSRSDIENYNAKHGGVVLNKSILPAAPEGEGFSLPLLIKGSSSYDIEDVCRGEICAKAHLFENSSEDKTVNFHSSSEDPSIPELSQEEKETEGTVSEAEIAIIELIVSHEQVAEDSKVRKQSSCGSEEIHVTLESKNENNERQNPKKGKKQKNAKQGKQGRQCKSKEKLSPPLSEKKVDFPDQLVKAHQNAYAYLNPNLSKYEVILCMASQATETQLIMQQMVSFLLFRFDEINHLLEEIAQDGEDLLKEVGANLAWPADKENPKEQPDLLQQLLQYTVNKMELLNGTVSSLTSDALQESCSFLQSAGSNLEEKLKVKQSFDERLLRMIKLLEASATWPIHSHPDDTTLYSEDSGIGIDSESVKDLNLLDKQGIQINSDGCSHNHACLNQAKGLEENQSPCTSMYGKTRSHECALERHFKDIFYPSAQDSKNAMPIPAVHPENVTTFFHHQNITTASSMHCNATHDSDHLKNGESTTASSTDAESGDNSLSEEEGTNMSLSGKRKDSLPSPANTVVSKRRFSTKQIDSSGKEEIILKMKDAISEKIKFVPAHSGKKEWIEDENRKRLMRPSTANASQKAQVKQRRSKSEESLKSHAEDPTLLELQRTQKGLSKRLEMFYKLNGCKDASDVMRSLNLKEPSNLQDSEHVTHRSSTNKLKASLAKNFSILPNQDKVPLLRHSQNAIGQQTSEWNRRKSVPAVTSANNPASSKENELPGTQKLNSVGCCSPRKSVKKLIETFSPSENLTKPTSLKTLGPIKCIKKFGLPSITASLPRPRVLMPLNHKHRISPLGDINGQNINPDHSTFEATGSFLLPSRSDTNEETNVEDDNDDTCDNLENLPPPPPEMLLGIALDSAESREGARTEENPSQVAKKSAKKHGHGTSKKITQISQRMKASLCSIDLLPSKNITSPTFVANKGSKNAKMDSKPRKHSLEVSVTHMNDLHQENPPASQRDHKTEVVDLYKQPHKIIPLQNSKGMPEQDRNEPGNNEHSASLAASPKQSSSVSPKINEKMVGFARRLSPARTPPSSPPGDKRVPSPPQHHRHSNQASSPIIHRQPSPPSNPRLSSSPTQGKLPSPPPQQNLSSPPMMRKQQSPPSRRKMASPTAHPREVSPPPFSATPSPPASPSRMHKGLQNNLESREEQQPSSPKIVSNVQSIFCPATSSLFEAKPQLPPNYSTPEATVGHSEGSVFAWRNSTQFRQYGDQPKRMALSAANPQPFVRRSFSDRKPGLELPIPLFATAGSDPVLSQTSMEENSRKEKACWSYTCFSEGKGASGILLQPGSRRQETAAGAVYTEPDGILLGSANNPFLGPLLDIPPMEFRLKP